MRLKMLLSQNSVHFKKKKLGEKENSTYCPLVLNLNELNINYIIIT